MLGGLGVLLGALGAHGLEKRLLAEELPSSEVEKLLDRYETGVRYQMYHAPVIVLIGLLLLRGRSAALSAAAMALLAGVLLFSGFLYASVFTLGQVTWLVHVVPFGGLLLIVGWVLLAAGAPRAAANTVDSSP
jgi:uncharacterized membrane protein YgdD (TMEM256/DUF423 family)